MNEYTYQQEQKGKNIFIKISVTILILLSIAVILFTNYRQEIFICSKSQDICYIEKTNLLNIKNKKKLLKYSDIKDISYIPQKVKGNRFAKGYTSYLLTIYTQNNNPVVVFSTTYFETEEIKKAVGEIRKQLKNNNDEIKYIR